MNVLRATLALVALASALWIATPAFADYCDNDARGYPCRNRSTTGMYAWSYENYRGDKNGDDRRNSGDGWYQWIFNRAQNYSLYAWLSNPSFTDTTAYYYCWDVDRSRWCFLKAINQNTAPSGWSHLGRVYTYVIHLNHGNRVTGADMVRGDVSTARENEQLASAQAIEESGRCGQLAIQDPRIAAIQQKIDIIGFNQG